MKTIYTLLITLLMLSGTISTVSAQSNEKYRNGRAQTERRAPASRASKGESNKKATALKQEKKESKKAVSERRANETNRKVNDVGRTSVNERVKDVRSESNRNEINRNEINRVEINRNATSSRVDNRNDNNRSDNVGNRNQNDNRDNELRSNRNQNDSRDNELRGNRNNNQNNELNRNRSQNDRKDNEINRNRSRYIIPAYNRNSDRRFRNDNERCRICFGIGYMFSHDRLHRLRCNTCRGRGFALGFGHNLAEFCPVCFTNMIIGRSSHLRSIEEIARIETNQLSVILDLSDRQANRIYRINLSYLRNRHGDIQYAMQERDKDILDVLNWRQQDMYLSYLQDIDYRDLCDNCYSMRL